MRRLIDMLGKLLSGGRKSVQWSPRGSRGGQLDKPALTKLFRDLGCADPEGWANSQVNEGINQLGRFLFIRRAWAEIVPEGDTGWIANILSNTPAETPLGRAWRRLLATGVKRSDLAMLIRSAQGELLFSLCHLMDDPEDGEDLKGPSLRWALFEVDDQGRPVAPIPFLHDSVLELDPARAADAP